MIPEGLRYGFSIGTVYPGRTGCEMAEHPEKKRQKHQILHESGREKSWTLEIVGDLQEIANGIRPT